MKTCDGGAVADTAPPAFIARARLPRWLLPAGWPVASGGAPALARLTLAEGRIADVQPESGAAPTGAGWDAAGAPVLPGLLEAHAHLDKAFTAARVGAIRPGLLAAIEAVVADRVHWTADDLTQRIGRGLQWALEAGVTRLRTHVDWSDVRPPPAWQRVAELAAEWAPRLQVEPVALVPLRFFAEAEAARAIARRVAATGPHAILGGFVHTSNWNPEALRHLITAAHEHGLDLDLHVDEELNPAAQGLAGTARIAAEIGFAGRIVCGHNCALAAMPEAQALATLDAVARAPITLVSLPITNLLLQDAVTGRTPRLRGITLVKEARARGIPLLIASDNVQDPFCRTGSQDPVDALHTAVLAAQLDDPFDAWSDTVCRADWLGRGATTARSATLAGGPADLVLFTDADAASWPARSARRRVLRAGRPQHTQAALLPHAPGSAAPA